MTPTHDPSTPSDHRGHLEGPAPVAQWMGLLLAPAVFALHFQGGYLLVLWACGRPGGALWIHAIGFLALVLAGVGVFAAWLAWLRAGREPPGEGPGPVPRTRILAATGLGMSAVLVLILIAQLVAGFVISPCH